MSVTRPPRHLFVHLKRFHYDDKLHDFRKLSSFIAFGAQQRLGNLHETAECDPLYELVAFVVHVGRYVPAGPGWAGAVGRG